MIDLAAIFSDVMAMDPSALPMLREQIRLIAAGAPNAVATRRTTSSAAPAPSYIAVIPITGVLTPQPTWVGELLGWTPCSEISAAVTAAAADDQVEQILLSVNSPGGSCFATQETGDAILGARSKKTVTAFVNPLCASGAYWLASQATRVLMMPSGQCGSVGVFAVHYDQSRALDAAGITATYVFSGRFKVEQNEDQPLTDEARAFAQGMVQDYYQTFVNAVARGRGVSASTVQASFGQGRMFGAREAVRVGMVDATANSLLDVVNSQRSERGRPASTSSKPRLAAMQRELEMSEIENGLTRAPSALARAQREVAIAEGEL